MRRCIVCSCFAVLACSGTVYEPPSDVPLVAVPGASARAGERPALVTPFGMNPLFDASLADPAAQPFFRASLTRPAKTFTDDPGTSLTALALLDTGKMEAKDLTPDRVFLGQQLAEGERAEAALPSPSACVTAIAHGGVGVTELDVFVVDGPDAAPTVIAEDTKSGPVAVAGGASGCIPIQGDARLVVIVRKGTGPIVARIYRRPP